MVNRRTATICSCAISLLYICILFSYIMIHHLHTLLDLCSTSLRTVAESDPSLEPTVPYIPCMLKNLEQSFLVAVGCLCVVFVCWLRLEFVPFSVAVGSFGSLRLLSILTIHSVCYPRPCPLQRFPRGSTAATKSNLETEHTLFQITNNCICLGSNRQKPHFQLQYFNSLVQTCSI
jgi:hypothetical protein